MAKHALPHGTMNGVHPHVKSIWNTRMAEPGPEPEQRPMAEWCQGRAAINQADMERVLKPLLERLTVRQMAVVMLRFYHDYTLEEVGAVLGSTRKRIRQIEGRALRIMRFAACKEQIRPLIDL